MQLINEQEWKTLPESAQQEVYDFFEFIKQRHRNKLTQNNKKVRIFGQHRGLVVMSKGFDDPLPDNFWLGSTE